MEENKIIILTEENLKCAMGGGRFLQVKDVQRNSARENTVISFEAYKQKMQTATVSKEPVNTQEVVPSGSVEIPQEEIAPSISEVPVMESTPVQEVAEVVPTPEPVVETPVQEVSMPEVPVQPEPGINMVSPVEEPVMESTPVVEEPTIPEVPVMNVSPVQEVAEVVPAPEPVVETPVQGVEIVSQTTPVSEYDALTEELAKIDAECNQKIIDINVERENRKQEVMNQYKQKIEEEKAQIIDLKTRAEEHLKNAQAAEQIATIAHQNAMNMTSGQVTETPMMEVPTNDAFPQNFVTPEVPSLEDQPVLAKVA